MKFRYTRLGWTLLSAASVLTPSVLQAAESRSIEEVVVTAERKESSVQDTSISITAFTAEMMDDFGIRNQSDLQNLVPATTIQPYDSAVRGVGRNFRNLGGDPGVATYMNGVYSEDLYTATIGSFWDIDRIEVLRGPQGTLYGRNAVGGAMNFLYKKPSDEFEFSAKAILGDYGTRDGYAVVSGPLIQDVLNGRLTTSVRRHDGWVEEKSGLGPDLDSGDEKNIAVQLEWLINEDMTLRLRSNRAKVDRVMGGANGGGLIVIEGENFLPGENKNQRNFDVQAHGTRRIDRTVTDPTNSAFFDASSPVYNFTNPTDGSTIEGQRVRPGIDPSADGFVNHGRNSIGSNTDCLFNDRENIDGKDLCAYTNGLNNETFNQQGNQLDFTWDISEGLTFKYIFGYNELLYERITDDDNTASLTDDRQFYVNHEAEYASHEFQLFWDVGDDMTFTSGVFFYDATIDQRGDFYSSVGSPRFVDPNFVVDNILGPGLSAGAALGAPKSMADAKAARATAANGEFVQIVGAWGGDASLGRVNRGIETLGTDLQYDTTTDREAFAAYTQGVWDINDKFTLTAGVRYAYDDIYGEENLARYAESTGLLTAFGINLAVLNIARGALDPATLQPTGNIELLHSGAPITFVAHRHNERKDEKVTWRVNMDYNINDDSLIYGNVTTGFRSGGFNLVFFSQTPDYEPEELIAYEIGYKSQFFDNTLQFNGSAYFYDYESIHTFTSEACEPEGSPGNNNSACAASPTSTSSVQAAPGAQMKGFEFEALWLATDQLTIGGNYSFTDSEYTESFIVIDGSDPTIPGAVYGSVNPKDRGRDVKGNQLLQVPRGKASIYGSYNIPMDGGGAIDLLSTLSWIDDVYFSAFETELDKAPAYTRLDLRATWTSPAEDWIVSGYINNAMDEIGIRQIIRHGQVDGFRRSAQVTEPRTVGVEVTYTFRD